MISRYLSSCPVTADVFRGRIVRVMRRCVGVLVVGTAISAMMVATALACPLCKEAVGEGGASGAGGLATGFFWSILAMLTVPFVLVGVVAYAIVSAYRHGAQRNAGAGATAAQTHSAS